MADGTKIEWTDATWNPIVGCSVLSPGCTNCYAMRQAPRTDELSIGAPWAGPPGKLTQSSKAGPVWTGAVRLVERRLDQPMRWRRPRKIFVNSMGDLFHEAIPDEWIDRVFAVMALAPQHTFQVPTKRAERMREYFAVPDSSDDPDAVHQRILTAAYDLLGKDGKDRGEAERLRDLCEASEPPLPLPNVWLGVSVEDQARADERIPHLLATPAAKRFVSAEPLIGPIDLVLDHECGDPPHMRCPPIPDWVIVGGESGPNARPMHPAWARSLRDQCAAAGVPFFFKQWGEWTPGENVERQHGVVATADWWNGTWNYGEEDLANVEGHKDDEPDLYRVGKAAAGRLLDGREHSEFPA